ncbi:MAG TPA: hypothetical protein VL651_14435, partial [Bacteroidia bacterium]|nr:hypothetical protein [Bacteroidia bacterium]
DDEASLRLRKELDDAEGMADSYVAIGAIYQTAGKPELARSNYLNSRGVYQRLKSRQRLVMIDVDLGELETQCRNYNDARGYLREAMRVASELKNKESNKAAYHAMATLDSATGNFNDALMEFKTYLVYRDSLVNDENTKRTVHQQMQYAFTRKMTTDSIQNAEKVNRDKVKNEEEIKQQQLYTYGGASGFLLMLVVAIVSIRAFRNKKKATEIIARQKELVEVKQKEILDSIHYAKRIQQSLLPSEKYIQRKLRRD